MADDFARRAVEVGIGNALKRIPVEGPAATYRPHTAVIKDGRLVGDEFAPVTIADIHRIRGIFCDNAKGGDDSGQIPFSGGLSLFFNAQLGRLAVLADRAQRDVAFRADDDDTLALFHPTGDVAARYC